MFCPNCGSEATGDQKFCRSCGMNLRKVAPALAEHLGEIDADQPEIESKGDLHRSAMRKLLWGLMLMFAGIAVSIIGKNFIHDEQTRGVGALITLWGMFLIVYIAISASYKATSIKRHPRRKKKVSDAKTTSQLTPEKIPALIPSITERTTDSLANAPIRSSDGRRSGELSV